MPAAPDPNHDQAIRDLKAVVASFEKLRADLSKKKASAIGEKLRILDDRIANNARTLEALKRSLEIAEQAVQRKSR